MAGAGDFVSMFSYDLEAGKWQCRRNCEVLQNFMFAGKKFYLLCRGNYYYAGLDTGKKIVMVWKMSGNEENGSMLPGEIVSVFRKGYSKNKITSEMLDTFLNNPDDYKKQYRKDLN